jgi:uncharacterized SAM-binding protein YcdF (DUF218 family)
MDDAIWLATNILKALLLPPTPLLAIALFALLAARRARWIRGAGIAALALLIVLSMPAVGAALLALLEADAPPLAPERIAQLKGSAATIVILGGGRRLGALDEPGQETISEASLERCVYGARLARVSGLPVIVSGGKPEGQGTLPEAQLMARVLHDDLGVGSIQVEDKSYETLQNARNVARLLGGGQDKRVVLVTHFYHMRGAAAAFAAQGFEVMRAPMGHHTSAPRSALDFLPNAGGLRDSSIALREFLRRVWYAVRL